MSDDPHPCTQETKNFYLCKLVLKTLLLTATTAAFAQEQNVPQHNFDVRSDKLTLTLGAENISALTVEQDKTVFYNNLRPNKTTRAENERDDYAQLKATEVLILEDKNFNVLTPRFMSELGRLIGKGGNIFFKAGGKKTEGAELFDYALEYYADTRNAYKTADNAERLVFGYQKGRHFFELGAIGKNGDGFLVIPNPKYADFWAQSGLTLLEKSGIDAMRFSNYDFAANKSHIGLRAWEDFNRGWSEIAKSVLNQDCNLYIRGDTDKSGVQFSVEYGKPKDQPSYVNLAVAANLPRFQTANK